MVSSHKATSHVSPKAIPNLHKNHPALFAINESTGTQVDKLGTKGVLVKVTQSGLAASIVWLHRFY